jgi:hypothetical protein
VRMLALVVVAGFGLKREGQGSVKAAACLG